MNVLLIVGGVLFLLLAFVLFIAAIVMFFVVRSRKAKAAGAPAVPAPSAPQPATRAVPVTPAAPAVAPPVPVAPHVPLAPYVPAQTAPPPAPAPEQVDHDKTVLTDPRQGEFFGTLHGTSGPLAGRVFPIDAAGFFIGRDRSTSQVVIDSPSISKRHLWVGVRDGAVMAVDQNSTNGTFLNDPNTAITEARLTPGDTLILGGDVARFVYRA
jgi:FHA domain